MGTPLRRTGIDEIGDQPWGTHLCVFYESGVDLLDLLIPYFKAGLELHEFCLYVASEPVMAGAAERALRTAEPNFEQYLADGQMEIISHRNWYLSGGHFNPQLVRQSWTDRLDQALAQGYAGMRFAANTFWLERQDWKSFRDHEQWLDEVFSQLRVMALCAYALEKSSAADLLDVVQHHQFAIVKRNGAWEHLEGSELRRAQAEIRRLNLDLEHQVEERTAQLAATNQHLSDEVTNRESAEEEIRHHAARMEALAGISQALAEVGLDVQAVFETFVRFTAELIGDAAIIRLLTNDEQAFEAVAFHHPRPEVKAIMALAVHGRPMSRHQEFFAHILRTGQGLLIPVIEQAQLRRIVGPDFDSYADQASSHSILLVPLRVDGLVIGSLSLARDDPGRPYTPEDQVFLQDLADRAALTIQNARLFQSISEQRAQLSGLSAQLTDAQEIERRAIARELHDEIGQQLYAVGANLEAISISTDAASATSRLAESAALVDQTIQQVRDLALELRPSTLDDFGLNPALTWLVERQAQRSGYQAEFIADPPDLGLPPSLDTAIYRVVQSALTNVARHARARHVTVSVRRGGLELELLIHDDGVGFDVAAALARARQGTTLGLLSMHERVRLAGGALEIDSVPGQGTHIRARFPLPTAEGQ
jgi:signal transduction histidine kinase